MIPPSAREIHPRSISVSLGKVIGHKYVSSGKSPATWKIVDYLLQIPGCYVSTSIKAPVPFDESQGDPYLTTLRFEIPNAAVV
jgi:hypothetical protein